MNAAVPGTSEYSTPSDREIRVVRAFRAPRKLVYEAVSNPKHVTKWICAPAASGASSTEWRTGRR